MARKAARLWGAAGALREEIGVPLQPENRKVLDPYLAAARSSLGEAAWQTALAEGRAMIAGAGHRVLPLRRGTCLALTGRPRSEGFRCAHPPRGGGSGTRLAGLTNRQIASELSISEHTVATHITRILKRLGLNSRSTALRLGDRARAAPSD